MKKRFFMFAAVMAIVALMTSCMKTEATVDVTVMKGGQPVSDVMVYKFADNLGESTTIYKSNANGSAKTNGGGVAHFDLKSPDDFAPSSVGAEEKNTFYFATYDSEDRRNGFVAVTIRTGEKLSVTINQE